MIKITDNLLSVGDHQRLQHELLGEHFAWYLNKYQVHPTIDSDPQHIHLFYDECLPKSNRLDLLSPLIDAINPATIRRIKANLTMRQSANKVGESHVDYDRFSGKTAVFYVNTTNGGTMINGELVSGLANRLVVFDADTPHSAVSCSDAPYRCVININFTEWMDA